MTEREAAQRRNLETILLALRKVALRETLTAREYLIVMQEMYNVPLVSAN